MKLLYVNYSLMLNTETLEPSTLFSLLALLINC